MTKEAEKTNILKTLEELKIKIGALNLGADDNNAVSILLNKLQTDIEGLEVDIEE